VALAKVADEAFNTACSVVYYAMEPPYDWASGARLEQLLRNALRDGLLMLSSEDIDEASAPAWHYTQKKEAFKRQPSLPQASLPGLSPPVYSGNHCVHPKRQQHSSMNKIRRYPYWPEHTWRLAGRLPGIFYQATRGRG
jgi:hypothetical protein